MQKRNSRINKRFIISIIFIYSFEFLANFLIKTLTSFHYGKDGGIINAALLHILICYFFFLIIKPSLISLIGLGVFIGFFSCLISIPITENINSDLFNWFDWMLLQQLIAATVAVLIGFLFQMIFSRIQLD